MRLVMEASCLPQLISSRLMYSRHEFGQVMLGGSIVSVAARTRLLSAERELPRLPGHDNIDDVIRTLKASGVRDIELSSFNVEPAGPDWTAKAEHDRLRRWRVTADVESYGRIKERLEAAGIVVHACAVDYDEQFTDREIQATFRQAETFGARVISFPASLDVARRLIPFRHAFASTGDTAAVAAVREYQLRTSHVLVRDRVQDDGRSETFGNGDTPIAEVLGLLKEMRSSIPVFDDAGFGTSVDEVLRCTQYIAKVLD